VKRISRNLIPILVLTLVITGLGAFVAMASGRDLQRPDLNSAGIWASSNADGMVGRFNKSASVLEFGIYPGQKPPRSVDVIQDENIALGVNRDQGRLYPINSLLATPLLERFLTLPENAEFALRGGTLAVLDPAGGKLWAVRTGDIETGLDLTPLDKTAQPLAELGSSAKSALAVASDGTIFAVNTAGKLVTILPGENGGFQAAETTTLPFSNLTELALTAVGDQLVVYSSEDALLYLPGGKQASLPAERVVLQQPGPAADSVLLATNTKLLRVSFEGEISELYAGAPGTTPSAPVSVSGCDFGVWNGDPGKIVRVCGEDVEPRDVASHATYGRELRSPAFRVNWNLVVLNDLATGRIYDWDLNKNLDDWAQHVPEEQPTPPKDNEKTEKAKNLKPTAQDDEWGVRPGRTATLYVVDNDNDPTGKSLSVVSVSQPAGGASVAISPDGQSVLYHQPADGREGKFTYTVSNGVATAQANVTVIPRSADQSKENEPPKLRENFKARTYTIGSDSVLTLAVASDWRDYDGDPVTVKEAVVPTDVDTSKIAVTSDGQVEYHSGHEQRDVPIEVNYTVTDGRATEQSLVPVQVLSYNDVKGAAPVAQPDVRRGVVGEAVTLYPLANDIPGVDPANPQTKLTLSADVEPQSGLEVTTDRDSGLVTIVASKANSYELNYSIGFGTAPPGESGSIRLDIEKKLADDLPVAVPDEAVLRGTVPVTIDVLKNDADPRGQMLSVVGVTPDDPSMLRASVTDKRWVRIEAVVPELSGPQLVRYQITNGDGRLVEGVITVTQLPAVAQDLPLLRTDRATVRAGDSVLYPVLENDSTTAGSSVQLVSNVAGQSPGTLAVRDSAAKAEDTADLGQALVVGQQVRYIAPASVDQARELQVEYYAQTNDGVVGQSILYISLKPAQGPDSDANRAPTPKTIEQRVVAGQQTTIRIPTSDQDPDGDLVSVVAIGAQAPSKGRIISFSPNAIIYEPFPYDSATGTDTFEYVVQDSYGAKGTGLIRVAVIQPGQTQPPVASDDQITAEPHSLVTIDVIDNDFIAEDDVAVVELVDPDAPAKVIEGRYVQLSTPAQDEDPLQVQYALRGNGDGESVATISLKGQEGFRNPPRTEDKVAEAVDEEFAAADVLENAYDPDSDVEKITVTVPNTTEEDGVTVSGGVVSVKMTDQPQVLNYIAADDSGAGTAGLIFVPSKDDGLPYSVGEIEIPANSTMSVNLADYVKTPRPEHTVKLAPIESLRATPAQLEVSATNVNGFQLTAKDDYTGPGMISVRVTDGDDLADPNGRVAVVPIKVQVGPVTPVLRCPKDAQVIRQGSEKDLDISTLCHLWPEGMEDVKFTAEWREELNEVTPNVVGGTTLHLVASGSAEPGAEGILSIGVADMDAVPQDLRVQVKDAAKPTMAAISMEVQQGTHVGQDLKLRSSIVNGRQDTVVDCRATNPEAKNVPCNFSGKSWSVDVPGDFFGKLTYQLTATDIADVSQADRHVSVPITITVFGVPDPPSAPTMVGDVQSHAITLTWSMPAGNGAAIDRYELVRVAGKKIISCMTTTCTDSGMANSTTAYEYQVRAHNRAGWSEYSAKGSGTADAVPTAVQGFYADTQRDQEITVHWTKLVGGSDFSPVKQYVIMYPGGSTTANATATSSKLTNLSNVEQTFVICAENAAGRGPCSSTKGWPTGEPGRPTISKVDPANLNADSTAVTVSWDQASPNGEGPVNYTLRDDGSVVSGCLKISARQCTFTVQLNGATHRLEVQALNAPEFYKDAKASKDWIAQGTPPRPAAPDAEPNGVNKQVLVSGSTADSRGPDGTAYVKIYSNGDLKSTQSVNARGGSYSDTITAGNNGATAQISVKLCYENPVGEEHCGPESSSRSVVPFGPMSLSDVDVDADGMHLIARVTADANGYEAHLELSAPGCSTQSDDGDGHLSATLDCNLNAWGASKTFTATLSTSSTPARATKTSTGSGTTPTPPAFDLPTISHTRDGNTVTITVHGDGKGYRAKLKLTGGCGTKEWYMDDAITKTESCTLEWDTTYSFRVEISNEEPQADSFRPPQHKDHAVPIPQRPNPSVRIYKGAAQNTSECTTSDCRMINVEAKNIVSQPYTCTLTISGPVYETKSLGPYSGNFDGAVYGPYGYTGYNIHVTCDGVSDDITW
jgi:hypothetical protein